MPETKAPEQTAIEQSSMRMQPAKAEKVRLTKEKETLLITLYAKALDNSQGNPILGDKTADDLIHRIDYNFEKLRSFSNGRLIVIRAKQLDAWVMEFLAANPDSAVLHLGCGLDSRVIRIDPPSSTRWFDIDYPEVIELRQRFYSERDGYRMIGSSVADPRWLDEIPADRSVMVIAEGLVEYLAKDDIKELLTRLTNRFAHGQIAFDVMNPLAARLGQSKQLKVTGASFGWMVDDSREIERLNPRLELIADQPLTGSPYVARMPWGFRVLCGVMNNIIVLRNMLRLLRYRF